MEPLNRRLFLGGSLGGLAAVFSFRPMAFAAPETLFLTWQGDPTTTMTVQWVAPDSADDASLEYAVEDSEIWMSSATRKKPFPNTDLRVYRCELTGLTPDTEYEFRIGMTAETHRFRTMPAKATDVVQFVSGGDCGVAEAAVATNRLAAKQDPRFALIGGDLAYDNGRSPEKFLLFLRNYHQHMVDSKGRMIPMITCIGNHEVDGGYQRDRARSPQYLSVFDGFFSEKTWGVLDIGDYMSIVLLDTGHLEPVEGEQTDWLERTLAERQDRPHLIVANHVPAYPSHRPFAGVDGKTGTGEDQRALWCPLFERYKVDAVLEHHDHTFKRTHPLTNGLYDKHGVLYLGDGSWGKLRAVIEPEQRPYLATYNSAYHVSLHRLEGDQRFHIALEEGGKVADVCVTRGKRPSLRG
ncbi:MAG: metallophosphoesterase family protein [Planctomyces sp.]|nr:metallophosphoesterase family protein [Planctomyces sp.]